MPDLDDIDPASPFIGISLQGNSTPSTVSENQCDRFGKGFYFKDIPNNNPPAQVINFSCNQMKENMFGVEFDNSNIGDQGSPNPGGVSHGNYWIYTDNGVLDVYPLNCKHLVANNYSTTNTPTWHHIDPIGGFGQVDFPSSANTLPINSTPTFWIDNGLDVNLTNYCEYSFVREGASNVLRPDLLEHNDSFPFSVFPNPNQGNFFATIPYEWIGCEFQLVNALGQMVSKGRMNLNNNEIIQSGSVTTPDGFYELTLMKNGEILGKQKVIVNR